MDVLLRNVALSQCCGELMFFFFTFFLFIFKNSLIFPGSIPILEVFIPPFVGDFLSFSSPHSSNVSCLEGMEGSAARSVVEG